MLKGKKDLKAVIKKTTTTVMGKPMREVPVMNRVWQWHYPIALTHLSFSSSLMEWRRHTQGRAECKQTELACKGN